MSRENLIHTLRDALETLGQKVRAGELDSRTPRVDEQVVRLIEGKRRRTTGPPLYW
jgi:hypothetical protein